MVRKLFLFILDCVLNFDTCWNNTSYKWHREYVCVGLFLPKGFFAFIFESNPLVSCVLPEVLYVSEIL